MYYFGLDFLYITEHLMENQERSHLFLVSWMIQSSDL